MKDTADQRHAARQSLILGFGAVIGEQADPDCQGPYECIVISSLYYWCMQWCTSDFDCSIYDSCYPLTPAVYVGGTEWGVCWDGWG